MKHMDAAEANALIKRLKRGRHGWSMTLPEEAGTCLGRRIDVHVFSSVLPRGGEPPLTDQEIDLLRTILTNLPKLAARAQKAWEGYEGECALDEDSRLERPVIWIERDKQAGKSAGAWSMIIGIAGSDYGWNVNFVRTRFKEIYGGD